jgi:hypothetical protein
LILFFELELLDAWKRSRWVAFLCSIVFVIAEKRDALNMRCMAAEILAVRSLDQNSNTGFSSRLYLLGHGCSYSDLQSLKFEAI